jgi:hypothetical protein
MPERQRIGDRVEQAIEVHADAERAIARGELEARRKRRRLRGRIFWLTVTGVSL